MAEQLTQDYLKKILDYDPASGVFVWKRANKVRKAGDVAGGKMPSGYARVKIGRCHYLAHRLAWLWVHGKWPANDIDHIDHNPSNNRIKNLRDVSKSENAQNQIHAKADGSSGFLGVSYRKDRGKYKATIIVRGRQKCLGHFAIAQDAHAAYVAAKRVMHSTCTI